MSTYRHQTIERSVKEFRNGTSVVARLETHIARADDPDGQGSIIYTQRHDKSARNAAAASDLRYAAQAPLSSLDGITFSIKDMFDILGTPMTLGLPSRRTSAIATRDAAVIRLLRDAGAIITGTTNMTPFVLSCLGVNIHLGTPLSPWQRDQQHITGGSSSGAAASVSDGMAVAAIATDTGGSARIPAAFCGLVGFKPSQGRVADEGCFPISRSLDSIGSIAQTVSCCAAIDRVIASPLTDTETDFRSLDIAVADTFLVDDLDPVIAESFQETIRRIAAAGATLRAVSVPLGETMRRIGELGGLSAVEAWQTHAELAKTLDKHCDPRVLGRYLAAEKVSAKDYETMLDLHRQMVRWANEESSWDILIHPTCSILPPRLADMAVDANYFAANGKIYRNAVIANLTDCCAITIPCPAHNNAPVGLTLMARKNQDGLLLSVARQLENIIRGE